METKKPKAKVSLKVSGRRTISEEDRAADAQSMGQVRKSIIFLGAVGIAYAIYLVVSGQFDDFINSLGMVDQRWIVGAMLCYVVYYIFGVSAYVLSVFAEKDSPVGIRDLMSVEASGIFFMNLTPNGAGAAPAQIYRLTRAGLSVGGAGALQFTRFVIYEAAEGIFAALMLIFRAQYFYDTFGDVTLIGIILFGCKIVMVGAILVLCLCPKVVMSLGNWGLRLANRHGWIRDEKYNSLYHMINTQVMEFSNGFKGAAKNIGDMALTMLVTLVQLGCLYALPYFVLRAFGEPADLVTCLASGSMLELLTSAIPLPGGTGGAETGFAFLFSGMFGDHIAAGYVLWRSVEYFLPTLAATPLLGLRSTSGESIHDRFSRYIGRFKAFVNGEKTSGKGSKKAAAGVTVKPHAAKGTGAAAAGTGAKAASKHVVSGGGTAGVDVAAKIAAGKAAAAAKGAKGASQKK